VRKPPEAGDDVVVPPCCPETEVTVLVVGERRVKLKAPLLVGEVLAVFEGEIDEPAPDRCDGAVEAAIDRITGRLAGRRVTAKGAGEPRNRFRGS